jgi:hypothetical protein
MSTLLGFKAAVGAAEAGDGGHRHAGCFGRKAERLTGNYRLAMIPVIEIGWFEDEIDDWIARRPRCTYPQRE